MLLWTLGCMCLFKLMFSFSSVICIYPGVELMCHMVVIFLSFWGTSILFSIVSVPIYILSNIVQEFTFLHILTNLLFVVFLTAILTGVSGTSSSFDLHISNNQWCWASFSCAFNFLSFKVHFYQSNNWCWYVKNWMQNLE